MRNSLAAVEKLSNEMRVVRFGPFEANFTTGELRKHGIRVKLQDQPFQVLKILLLRPGELVTREEIRQSLWPSGTFVDFDNGLNAAVNRLREALGDSAEGPRLIETLPRRGYRFIGALDQPGDSGGPPSSTASPPAEVHNTPVASSAVGDAQPDKSVAAGKTISHDRILDPVTRKERVIRNVVIAAALAVTAAGIGAFVYSHRVRALTDKDTIILADFNNSTGDPVFDGTLRQGLSVQLEQSPFLSIVSDQQVQQTLRMMGQTQDVKVTPEIAGELCLRTRSAAVLEGSIAQVGMPYLITLKAVNCSSGETLASTETQASDKNHVLDALGKTASDIRNKLGESLTSMRKFDTPLEQATTSSLEALQAYTAGRKANAAGDDPAAVPLFELAVRLDPNFAAGYGALATSYFNLGEFSLGAENTQKAYELRERVSERERFYIESRYNNLVSGDLEKARETYELWEQTYPRDDVARRDLGVTYQYLGQYDKALEEWREALRIDPANRLNHDNVVDGYLYLNRVQEARATAEEALMKKLDSPYLRLSSYQIAFLQGDAEEATRDVAWAAAKPGWEDVFLASEADSAAYSGQLAKARGLSRLAVASAERAEEKETAASYEAVGALREALFGNPTEARNHAAAALALSKGRDVQSGAALALALAGDTAQGQPLADDLARRFPEDTIAEFNYLPTIRAQLALSRNDVPKALDTLQSAAPYELGAPGPSFIFLSLYPVYIRGEAYLTAHRGNEAAAEFQKILDHRGVVVNEPIGALAHLQIGRAYAMEDDTTKAKAAYQDFLALWKDADPDIPILKQAKAEYAKLQ